MTETPQQEHERPASTGDTDEGVRTENLRDYQQLRRSLTDRKVAGVAGGLGRHLNVDPTVLRVAFAVLTFFGGAGAVLYGVAWLLVPEDGHTDAAVTTNGGTRNTLLLVAAGVAAVLVVADSWGGLGFSWPLGVLALIAFVILMNRDKNVRSSTPPTAPESWAASTTPPTTQTTPVPPNPPNTPTAPAQPRYVPPAAKPDRGTLLFGPTLALLAVVLGSLGLYDVSGGSVVASAYAAAALAAVGVMLVLGSWVGRAGGLILLGLVATIALAVTSVVGSGFADARNRTYAPASTAVIAPHYFQPAGRLVLDLRNVSDVQKLDQRVINVRERFGEIVLLLPHGVLTHVTADVRVGDAAVNGRTVDGPVVHINRVFGTDPNAPDLHVNLDLFIGHIEVRQS
jgi:phage shock protein PspC (stress-responsive transcriptional regulator)